MEFVLLVADVLVPRDERRRCLGRDAFVALRGADLPARFASPAGSLLEGLDAFEFCGVTNDIIAAVAPVLQDVNVVGLVVVVVVRSPLAAQREELLPVTLLYACPLEDEATLCNALATVFLRLGVETREASDGEPSGPSEFGIDYLGAGKNPVA